MRTTPATSRRAPRRHRLERVLFALTVFSCIFLAAGISLTGQTLPGKIRGYKVHTSKILVAPSAAALPSDLNQFEAVVVLGEPRMVSLGLSGLQLKVPFEVRSAKVTGEIEFVSFHDLQIDGSSITVDEIRPSLKLPKKAAFPVRGFADVNVSGPGILKAGLKSVASSGQLMNISGTAFVFGIFDKLGMRFKRVIPIRIKAAIPNPLTNSR